MSTTKKVIVTSFPRGTASLLDPVGADGYEGEAVSSRHRLVALLDDPWHHAGGRWDVGVINGSYCLDPEMRSKQVKICFSPSRGDLDEGHQRGPCQVSLWVDPGIEFGEDLDLDALTESHLRSSDLCAFRHPEHDCAYEYAEELRARFPGRAEVISGQVDRYLREGLPRKHGLLDTSVLLRRHTDRVREICYLWWREVLVGDRDVVLSLAYAMWKVGDARASEFPGRVGRDFSRELPALARALLPCDPYFRKRT